MGSDEHDPHATLRSPGLAETMDSEIGHATPGLIDFGDRFDNVELAGSGGMGSVYRAHDRELDEVVALKTLHPAFVTNRDAVARFRREVKLARRITHPNIARIHELHVVHGGVFLSMEFVDGEPLDDRLRRVKRLDPEPTADIARAICAALGAAHAAGVVHRDLKPANVIVASDDRVVVTDFGIATVAGTSETGGLIVGTPHYIAPEQARGLAVDGRTDLYALGVMLFEMLTGAPPWTGETTSQVIMERFLVEPPTLPRELAVEPRLSRLVPWLMALEPDGRPPSAAATLRELDPKNRVPEGTLELPPVVPTNIPIRANSFVGREAELEDLRRRVTEDGQRLITVLGPGGVGKTRLAQEFGTREVAAFEGGTWFCSTASVTEAEEVYVAIAHTFGVPLAGRDPEQTVVDALASRALTLLVLDNAELAIDAVSEAIGQLLRQVRQLAVVVTSRVRLRLAEEFAVQIGPLKDEDASKLFIARARQNVAKLEFDDAGRETVAAIVRRVDHLPLAIELAAGRLGMLSLDSLLDRLQDQLRTLRTRGGADGDRHATLQAAIDDSWSLLRPEARLALAQLSVFAAGGTLEAAAAVIDVAELDQELWHEDLLEELWDHSMIHIDSAGVIERFSMLSAIREYAATKLEAGARSAAEVRHARFYGDLSRTLADEMGLGIPRAAALAEVEFSNVTAALRVAIPADLPEVAANAMEVVSKVCERLGWQSVALELGALALALDHDVVKARANWLIGSALWRMGRPDEAFAPIDRGLALQARGRVEAPLHLARGNICWAVGKHTEALREYEEAERLFLRDGDLNNAAIAHGNQGLVHWNRGDLDRAQTTIEGALARHREAGGQARQGAVLCNLGVIASDRGDMAAAAELYREALEAERLQGDRRSEGLIGNNLGNTLRELGQHDDARRALDRALVLNREVGDQRMVAITINNLATVDAETGHPERALQLFDEALRIHRETSDARFEGIGLTRKGRVLRTMGRHDDARAALTTGESVLRALDNRTELAKVLCELGLLAVETGDVPAAHARLTEARDLADRIGVGPGGEVGKLITELDHLLASV